MSVFFNPIFDTCGKAPKDAVGAYPIDEGGNCVCVQGERLSGEVVVNGLTRPEDLSWIKGELVRLFPNSDLEQGIDINGDGSISNDERVCGQNKDGFTCDESDLRSFLEKNMPALSSLEGIFKWGALFRSDNIINDIIGVESETYSREDVNNAYSVLTFILNAVRKRTEGSNLGSMEKLQVLLAITKEMGYSFGGNDIAGDLVSAIKGKRLDCDTFSFIALAVSEELGWNLKIAVAPLHVYMRLYDANAFSAAVSYVEPGELKIENEQAYIEEEGVTDEEQKRGIAYFRDLSREEIKAMQLCNRGWGKIEKGLYQEAIKYFDLAMSWNIKDPYIYSDKGMALVLLGRREEAVENFKKALTLHGADWLIKLYLKTFSNEPSTSADYLTQAVIYFEYAELYKAALESALKAIELGGGTPKSYNFLSRIYVKLGDTKKAAEALKKSLPEQP